MKQYKYSLFRGSRKWICPECGRKTFVCYVDEENNVLHESVGRCDREQKCQYHYTPKQYFSDNGWMDEAHQPKRRPVIAVQPQPSFVAPDILKQSLGFYRSNRLVAYLDNLFNQDIVSCMIYDYFIGTSDHWPGSTVFWQVDYYGKIHGGKVMLYNSHNGKRVKEPFNHVSWVHKVMGMEDFNLSQCLFGEHLLRKKTGAVVVIVESEKSAIMLSGILQGCVCLAVGGCQNLTPKICASLKGRDVLLLPDNGKFQEWSEKGSLLTMCRQVTIADVMEHRARNEGDDVADLIPLRDEADWDFCNWGENLLWKQ